MAVSGPTQGAERHEAKVNRWKSHPRLAMLLRVLILLLPISSSIGFTILAGRLFPADELGMGRWTWIFMVFVLANVLLVALRKVTERLIPLVALMKLTLVFPDHAPSRARATLRRSSSRSMLRNIEEARARGEESGEVRYGDYLVQMLTEVNEHDRLTRGHSERVRAYSEMIGEELELSDDEMNKLRWSALLHDVGKITVPSEILNKDGRPTEDEWRILSNHPAAGGEMLEPLRDWLGDWVHSADQHHCRWDGNGYPEKLKGEEITLAGRLVAIADAYDVMTSARSYKKPLSAELARQELTACAGTQFDPKLVRAFLQVGLTKLKTVAGPLAWLANLTGSLQLPVPAAGVVSSGAVSAGVASAGIAAATVGGLVPSPEPEAPVLAFEDPAPIVEIADIEVEPIAVAGLEGNRLEIVLRARGGEGELTFEIVSAPEHGDASFVDEASPGDTALVADVVDGWERTVVYEPTPGYFGDDGFTFEVCDSVGTCETHTAMIGVSSSNRSPVARDDSARVDAGTSTRIDVLANDDDPDGDTIVLRSIGQPSQGQVSATGPTITYRADGDADGVDSFTYTIADAEGATATGTVDVIVDGTVPPTTAPTTTTSTTTAPTTTTTAAPTTTTTLAPVNAAPIVADDVADVLEDESVLIPVLTNDRDPEGGPLTVASVGAPSNGSAVIEGGGVRYTPDPDFAGVDTFTYTASDGDDSTAASVTITVTNVNDPPAITATAVDVSEDAPIGATAFSIDVTDIDGDAIMFTFVSGNDSGHFSVDGAGEGTVAAPLDYETASTYPLEIAVDDGTVTTQIPVEVRILDINERPTAGDDLLATTEDQPVVFDTGANDTDPDGDALSWSFPATTGNGTPLVAGADGNVSYTPPPDTSGADSFTYTVADPDGLVSSAATVTVMVVADNDPPVANADGGPLFATTVNVPFTTGDVTLNDTDIDSPIDPSSVTVVDDVANGTLTNNANGTFDYTPDAGWSGTDTFTYVITDADGASSATATVSIDVTIVAVADAGGPYSIAEGDDLPLDASASTGPATSWNWDLDGDGQYDDATGETPLIPWATLYAVGVDDDGSYTIGVLVDGDTATASLSISNVAPILTTSGAAAVVQDDPYTLNLAAIDPGNDAPTTWTINWGDGTIETIAGNPASVTHVYTRGNFTYDILASATDEDVTVFQNELLVPSYDGDAVFRFDTSGTFLQSFASADDPIEALINPSGELLVSSDASDNVLRHNAETGALIDEFVAAGSSPLNGAEGIAYGPDGNLYVADYGGDNVLRYDGSTGAYIDVFASSGLDQPYDVIFGPDSNLYVSSYNDASVRRFDGTTGAPIGIFVSDGDNGLDKPEQMAFGPDGHLYIASFGSDEVLRYDGTTGAFIDVFVASGGAADLDEPTGLAFGPDGNLYVGDHSDAAILRFDGTTGAFIDQYVAPGEGGLTKPDPMTFLAKSRVQVTTDNSSPVIVDPGDQAGITGAPFSLQIDAADLETSTLTYSDSGLPAGLSIDTDGLISGSPSASGTSTVTITVSDDGTPALSDAVTFDIVVEDYALSSLAGAVHLTEVLYVGTTFPTEEFVELTNSGATPVDLTGFILANFDRKNDGADDVDYAIPATDHWGAASTLQPGEQAVIWLSYDGATLPPLTNPATGLEYVINNGGGSALDNFGDSVWLMEDPDTIIDYMAYFGGGGDTPPPAMLNLWDDTDQGALVVGAFGRSLALTPHNVDGDTASCWEETGTGDAAARCPGAPTTVDQPSGGLRHSAGLNNNGGSIFGAHVVISEFSNTGGDTGGNDFIELYNPTATSVDIEGWQLEIADDTAIQQTILLTGPNTVLPSGGHYLIDVVGGSDQTLVALPDELAIRIRDGGTAVDEVGTRDRNNGGSLNAGLWVEGVGVPPLVDETNYNQSYERLLASGVGNCVDTDNNAADFERRLSYQVNPQSSADPVEPCGSYPAVTPPNHLVITEYRTDGPNGGGDELVEIFNPTSSPISLNGYELRKEGSGGNEYVFPNINLQPGQSYLTGGSSYAGPTDDTHNGFGNGDGVELYDTIGDAIVDVIVIGNSPPDLPNLDGQVDQSYQRRIGGCFYSGVLIDDFFSSGSTTPRTSSDPAIPC